LVDLLPKSLVALVNTPRADQQDKLKDLALSVGRFHQGGGDGGRSDNILIPLSEILK
jgi:hypothetical protein